ncbi:MAG: hypothetical protein QOK00_2881, partial [Thermoleophilaceae bacterium]|nr:hypothetical protein [Thermoleophilaceae bacterium]
RRLLAACIGNSLAKPHTLEPNSCTESRKRLGKEPYTIPL